MSNEAKLFCGCFNSAKLKAPQPQESKYISDVSSSIAINTKHSAQLNGHFSWLIEVDQDKLRKDFGDTSADQLYIEAQFPDPAADLGDSTSQIYRVKFIPLREGDREAGSTLAKEGKQEGKKDDVTKHRQRYYAISPALTRLNCRVYPINAVIYADMTRQKEMARHESGVLSRVDTQNCLKEDFMQMMSRLSKE